MFEILLDLFWAITLLLERNLAKFWKIKKNPHFIVLFSGIWDSSSSWKTELENFIYQRGETHCKVLTFTIFLVILTNDLCDCFKLCPSNLRKIQKINQRMLYYSCTLYYSLTPKNIILKYTRIVKISIKSRGNCLFFTSLWNPKLILKSYLT